MPSSASIPLPQRVLVVDNSKLYANMLAEAIDARSRLPVSVATSLADAKAKLAKHDDYFVILSGLVLPDAKEKELIEQLSQTGLPVVIASGKYDEALRERIVGRSVIDYVIKSAPGHIDYLAWLVQRLDRNRRISALVVDDSASARLHTADLLSTYGFEVVLAAGGEQGLKAIEARPDIRLVITDHEMPSMSGVEFTAKLREKHNRERMAIIAVSGANDPALLARFLKTGANDFLHKPFSREEFFCRVSQNVDNLDLIGTLQDLATRDFLTGLPNRRYFFEQGHGRLLEAQKAKKNIAVAMLDIDHFKKINDNYGHDVGDLALKAVAEAVSIHASSDDTVARFGGEEFCVFTVGLDPSQAMHYFENLRQSIANLSISLPDSELKLTVSIGVCFTADGNHSLHEILLNSDKQLYLAKAGGRNQVKFELLQVS